MTWKKIELKMDLQIKKKTELIIKITPLHLIALECGSVVV